MEIKDLAGLSQPLTKLIDCVSCGIGKFYEPVHIKRMAKAKADEIRLISEATNENINLPMQYSHGELTIDTQDAEKLLQRTRSRLLFQEMQKQQNIESVVENAYEELKDEVEVSEEAVDKDWMLRFFNSVEDVSSEDMQRLWGKILAGEIRKPGGCSLRTLEVLRNMSKKEAELLQKIATLALWTEKNSAFIFNNEKILLEFEVSYEELLILEECGIIKTGPFLSYNLEFNNDVKEKLIFNKNKVVILSADGENSALVEIYKYTVVGNELLNIIDFTSNQEYFEKVIESILKKNNNLKATLHKINYIDGNKINYEKLDLWKKL